MVKTALYHQLGKLSDKYPGLERAFIDELIEYHLKIDSIELNLAGLRKLKPWLVMLAGLMIDKHSDLKSFLKSLNQLAE